MLKRVHFVDTSQVILCQDFAVVYLACTLAQVACAPGVFSENSVRCQKDEVVTVDTMEPRVDGGRGPSMLERVNS